MSSDAFAIRVSNLSKQFVLFERPEDRLKQMVIPRLERLTGRSPRRYYRDFAALDDVSFEIKRGETVGIIGRNGSGKSTLLQIICGTLRPTRGVVEVNGRVAALLELGAGFNPDFTGRENVLLNAAILGLTRTEIERRFDDIARFADIGLFIDQPVKTYSSGMYVRLAFATAINVDPDILVVDEALAVGDEAFQRKCYGRIEQIKEQGGTILFVSHGAQTIVQLCTRAMLFDNGELLLEGRPKAVVSQYQRLANASAAGRQEIRTALSKSREATREQPAACTRDEESATRQGTFGATAANAVETLLAARPRPAARTAGIPSTTNRGSSSDHYDPLLASQSTLYLEERGARIRDARILTLGGQQVNVLQMGKRYVFEYYVDFAIDAAKVGFGMMVRTVNGLRLAGATSPLTDPTTLKIAGKQTSQVRIEFTNLFCPDVYFCACGVNGIVDGERIEMHRATDLLCFRSQPEPSLSATGLVDFNALTSVRHSSKPESAF
jgi:lipopolysaccharide transport system ATP-binding protein